MYTRKLVAVLALLLQGALSWAQTKDHKDDLAQVIALINKKDSPGLLALMADSCTIGNLPPMNNAVAVPEILSKFDGFASYDILGDSILPSGDHLLSLEVRYSKGNAGKPTFTFNKVGKLVNLGIIKARKRADPSKALDDAMAIVAQPDTMRVSFVLDNGLIYVPATLNGRNGYFFFDSGAPVLILDRQFLPPEKIDKTVSVDFTGMGGAMQDVQWSAGNSMQWSALDLPAFDAPAASMGGETMSDGSPIFGLMGYGILKGYEITFDYQNQEILLARVDSLGNARGASFDKGTLVGRQPLRMKRHIPIIDLAFAGKSYPMGIDCGANANVMKQHLTTTLKDFIEFEEGTVGIAGVGGTVENNRTAFVMQGKVGDVALQDMYTVFTDQAIGAGQGDNALPIEGLLGTPFLNQYRTTINFNKGEIAFYQ